LDEATVASDSDEVKLVSNATISTLWPGVLESLLEVSRLIIIMMMIWEEMKKRANDDSTKYAVQRSYGERGRDVRLKFKAATATRGEDHNHKDDNNKNKSSLHYC